MTVEHDVPVPMMRQRPGGFTAVFKDFLESDHETMKITYDDVDTAKKSQKTMCMARDSLKAYNVTITRRQNMLYLIRDKGDQC